jgi:hypothetical protein
MNNIQIRINNDKIRFIHNDELIELLKHGEPHIKRASHVEPDGISWFADMSPSNGPKLGPFNTRKEALEAEVDWIIDHKIPTPR